MLKIAALFVGMTMVTADSAQALTFDRDPTGAVPTGWTCGRTGKGLEHWEIVADPGASDGRHVLRQSGAAAFAWCVRDATSIADGFVETKFKPVSGREDQAGGVVWRWKDGDNYYVARANALENNVSLYYTAAGKRVTIKYVDAPVSGNTWQTLRVEFHDHSIRVLLNGKLYITADDPHIVGTGKVGVWTKADSVTAFDELSWGTSVR